MRPFFIIWSGQICSWFGSGLVQFAIVWWLTATTGSATVLAFSTTMAVLPQIVIGPFAGTLVDRWDRRMVMIVADAMIALTTVVVAVLYGLGVVQVWHVYVLLFIRALAGVFDLPALTASTSLLVPEQHLARVAGLNQTVLGVLAMVSPPLGALLLGLVPMPGMLAIEVATVMLSIGALLLIPIPRPPRQSAIEREAGSHSFVGAVLADLRDGVRFAWGFSGLRIMIAMFMLLNLLAWPLVTLAPILITRHFSGGAVELGWFQAALGVGGILGGFVLGLWGGFQRRAVTMVLALILEGGGSLALGLAPAGAFLLGAGAWFFVGFMGSLVNGTSLAILQATVPADLQGRVFAVNWSCVTAMAPLGLAIAGPVADWFGASIWYVIAGLALTTVGIVALFTPPLMRIEG
jgi:MFS transporter, DHA3 family, macrolide efflux protein